MSVKFLKFGVITLLLSGFSGAALAHGPVSQSGIYFEFQTPLYEDYGHRHHVYREEDRRHQHRPVRRIESGSVSYKLESQGQRDRSRRYQTQRPASRSWER